MKFEKACYSRKALYECCDKVKALPRAARVRADHSALCYGVLAQTFDFVWRKQVVVCLNVIFRHGKITQKR